MDTRPRTSLISFCTVQLRTLCAAHSLATLCLFTTSGPDPGELPGFWGSMVFRHAPIPRKGSGNQQQQHVNSRQLQQPTSSSNIQVILTELLHNIDDPSIAVAALALQTNIFVGHRALFSGTQFLIFSLLLFHCVAICFCCGLF